MSTTQLAANETRRQLRYNYTLEERNAKATELVAALNRIDATNSELDRIKGDYKSRLSAIESESELLRGCVLSGYELRDYLCYWTFDEPRAGRKTLRKREGNEVVAEEDMTERDRQMVMEIIESQAMAEADERGLIPMLALANTKAWPTEITEIHLTEEQAHGYTDFDGGQVADWRERLAEIFVNYEAMGKPATIRTPDEAAQYARSLIDNTHDAELARMAEWLTTGPRAHLPGTEWLASEIMTYLDAVAQQQAMHAEAEKARQAEAKKKARAGRRASTSGTVSVASDEGTRDDAGSDSKNNL
jgi:hypothetical protein